MKKTFIKFLPMMAAAMLATSCNNDDETINPANGRDGVHTVSTPETSGIPFAIKVDTRNSLSKIGFTDNGTNVTVSFVDADVNNLTMGIYSNEKSDFMTGSAIHYGDLTLTDKNGVFT